MNDHRVRFNKILTKLRENNYRITPQRLAIIKILAASKGHPCVETIYKQIKRDFPTMSLATVYKNVAIIKDIGEVLELELTTGNRYDGNNPDPHPHLICTKCKKIVDPKMKSLQNLIDKMAKETGYKITNHRLDFFGLCLDCQNQE